MIFIYFYVVVGNGKYKKEFQEFLVLGKIITLQAQTIYMSFINRLNAPMKLLISVIVATIFYLLLTNRLHDGMLHFLLSWDAFCTLFLTLNWVTFFTVRPQQIRAEARKQDEGRVVVFIIALIATLVALLAVILLLVHHKSGYHEALTLITAFGGMMLSWSLVHTVFAGRYAHIYYADHKKDKDKHAGGLDFPEEEHPDFLDFAYFSFIIGMTFQVSDVSISSRRLRRLALLHSLMAFAFNTVIVALTINVIAGLSE